ncbi:MAG: hypothetical protein F4Y86_10130 [Gammaproteobacteria bacterium]|nr:hypothetical protein [Gammaproteobacteria bacterium]MYB38858.1 hypothetical protein [Gammaproteobacteria bacterium]
MTAPCEDANALRASVLASVEQVAPLLDGTAARSERERTLCREALDALHDAGLFGMWVPREAGGLAADLATQVDALIALARADMSAAWTLMIGNTVTGTMAACLPDAGFAEVFTGPRMPVAAGALRATGKATPTATGGYRVTGNWAFGSGIHHADWIVANCRVDGGEPGTPERVSLAIPIADVAIADDWHASGMRGSGSSSYSVRDVDVPARRILGERQRGSPFAAAPGARLPLEHASVSLGGARRALDEVANLASTKRRMGASASLAHDPTFRRDLGRLEAEWSSLTAGVRAAALELEAKPLPEPATSAIHLHAVCAFATEQCLAIASQAIRHAGASAGMEGQPLERIHRDLTIATQHVMVSDTAYAAFGGERMQGTR